MDHGGTQIKTAGGGGGGSGQPASAVPPSGRRATAQPVPPTALLGSGSQTQPLEHSAFELQTRRLASQWEVASVVVVHSGGAASEGAGEGLAAALGAGAAPVGLAEPLPMVPEPATPPLPRHEVVVSGTQVNPGPQDASVEHGTRYRGTQPVTVVVVQGSGVDGAHFVPGAQSAAVSVGQTCCVSDTHTMPLAQSAFAVQGSGTHSWTSVGVHVGQVCPGAHAIAGHDDVPVTWQL